MPIRITINLYTMEEVRSELASRTGRQAPYSRQRVYDLVAAYLTQHAFIQGKFLLTDEEIEFIARSVKGVGRPRKS